MNHTPLILRLPFEPVPTARAKVTKWGTYDPNAKLKKALGLMLNAEMAKYRGWKLLTGPLQVQFIFNIKRPKNHYRTGKFNHLLKDSAYLEYPSRADFDNYAKFIADAMSGIVYVDDRQIVKGAPVGKQYAGEGKAGSIEVKIEPWDYQPMSLT